jgi:dienelactone hydrolase
MVDADWEGVRFTRRTFAAGAGALVAATCGPHMNPALASPMIVIDQPVALIDATVAIELRGFPPRQPVTITAIQTFPSGSRWQARATFMSDDDGCVYVARQAPISGTYDGVSAMGLIWSAERLPGEVKAPPVDFIMRPWFVEFEATSVDGMRAEFTFERRVAGPGVTRHPIRTEGIVGTLFLPPGDGPHPAVIVLSGGGGGIDEYRGAILASHGCAALNLGYFAMEGLPRGLVNIPLEYFETAIRWMRAQPWLRDHFLAVWGESRGGELALLLGATFTEINAVIAWVPSGVVFWALGPAEPGDTRPRAAWTFRGKPLPYLQQNNTAMEPLPVAEAARPVAYTPFYLSHLRDARAAERATIPVEQTRGPILLVSAADDQMWPSSVLADIAMRRLEAHRHPYPFRHLKYEGAGHLILVPGGPRTVRTLRLSGVEGLSDLLLDMGGTPKSDAEAGDGAWRSLLEFLEACIKGRK